MVAGGKNNKMIHKSFDDALTHIDSLITCANNGIQWILWDVNMCDVNDLLCLLRHEHCTIIGFLIVHMYISNISFVQNILDEIDMERISVREFGVVSYSPGMMFINYMNEACDDL